MFLAFPQHFQHINNITTSLFSKQHNGQIWNIHDHASSNSFHTIFLHKTSNIQSKLFNYPFRTPKRPIPLESMGKKFTLTLIRGYRCEALAATVPMHLTVWNLVRKWACNVELCEVAMVGRRRREEMTMMLSENGGREEWSERKWGFVFYAMLRHMSRGEWSRLAPPKACHLFSLMEGWKIW